MAEPEVIISVKKLHLLVKTSCHICLETWLLHQIQIMAVQLRKQANQAGDIYKNHMATNFVSSESIFITHCQSSVKYKEWVCTYGVQSGPTNTHIASTVL